MIVVATTNFEVYHGVVTELRDRDVPFTTRTADDPFPANTTVVITGPTDDQPAVDPEVDVIQADPGAPREAVDEAMVLLRGGEGRMVVGVDPGDRPGIAVLSGDTVVGAFQVPASEAASVITRELEDAADPLVRIGDGARLKGTAIIEALSDVPIELVDETGSTPYLGTGARGMGDVLAAVNIARVEGDVIDDRVIEPTAGELQAIKNQSREMSTDDRTITETLARRVAVGDLSLDEALDEHRHGDAHE